MTEDKPNLRLALHNTDVALDTRGRKGRPMAAQLLRAPSWVSEAICLDPLCSKVFLSLTSECY